MSIVGIVFYQKMSKYDINPNKMVSERCEATGF